MVDRQLLLASATTEIGVGGDIRTSLCAVERQGGRFRLEKQAPVISYGEQRRRRAGHRPALARQPAERPGPGAVPAAGLTLEAASGWDTLGFRGTCSLGSR